MVDVDDMIRLAEIYQHTDRVAASNLRRAAAEILRLRRRLQETSAERDTIRSHLWRVVLSQEEVRREMEMAE